MFEIDEEWGNMDLIDWDVDDMDDVEEELPPVRFNKTGDALRYGLLFEIPNKQLEETTENKMFRSAIMWMYFNRIISIHTLIQCDTWGDDMFRKESSVEAVKKIVKALTEDISKVYQFKQFQQLVEVLNELTIPDWLLDNINSVSGLLPYVDLVGEELYYLMEQNHRDDDKCLCCVNVNHVSKGFDFKDNYVVRKLGNGYKSMFGGYQHAGRLYLTLSEIDDGFVAYDCCRKIKYVIHQELHDVIAAGCVVFTEDGMLAYRLGNLVYPFKECLEGEDYGTHENLIAVMPHSKGKEFFKPYYVSVTGEIRPYEEDYVKDFLWKYIVRHICRGQYPKKPSQLTVEDIRKTLTNEVLPEVRTCNKQYLMFMDILSYIEKYVGLKKDITDLLYDICDYNKKFENPEDEFPTEDLMWMFNAFEINCGASKENFPTMFHREKPSKEKLRVEREKQIGTFMVSEDNIEVNKITLGNGMVMDPWIIPPFDKNSCDGMVAYNTKEHKYILYAFKEIRNNELEELKEFFGLQYKKLEVVVDLKE